MKKLRAFLLIQATLLPLTLQTGGPSSPTQVKNSPEEEEDIRLWKTIQTSRMPNLPRCNRQQIDQAADDVVKKIGSGHFRTSILNKIIIDIGGYVYGITIDEVKPAHPEMEEWLPIASKARDAANLKVYELFRKTIDDQRVYQRLPVIWATTDLVPMDIAKIIAAYADDGDELRKPQ